MSAESNQGLDQRIAADARSDFLPLKSSEQEYGFWSLFGMMTSAAVASWCFLMGTTFSWWLPALPAILVMSGGFLLASQFPTWSASGAAVKYGVDTAAFCKVQFGVIGAYFPIVFTLFVLFGTAGYLFPMFGGTVAGTLIQWNVIGDGSYGTVQLLVGLALVPVAWLMVKGGANSVRSNSLWIAVSVVILGALVVGVTLKQYGIHKIFSAEALASSGDKQTDYMMAIEYCFGAALTWWCWLGAMARLAKSFTVAVRASILGLGFMMVPASLSTLFASLATGETDPALALTNAVGPWLSIVVVIFLFLANTGTIVVTIFAAGVTFKSIPGTYKLKWPTVAALMTLGCVPFAALGGWWIDHLATFFFVAALFPIQYIGIQIVDYYLLRRRRLDLASIYVMNRWSKYWYWKGVNWVAVIVSVLGAVMYLQLINPITYETHLFFKYTTATLPTMAMSAVLYYVLERFIVIPLGKGGYERYQGKQAESSAAVIAEGEARA
jgi:NCS1 family nucleobase:cation symporter-1